MKISEIKKIPCKCSVKDTRDKKREPKRGETEQNRRLVTKQQRIITSEQRFSGLFGVFFFLWKVASLTLAFL